MSLPSIRQIWHQLGLAGDPPPRDKQDARCPFADRHRHGDRRPSFALLNQGMHYCCHGCNSHGGVLAFIADALGTGPAEAKRWLRDKHGRQAMTSEIRPVKKAALPLPPAPLKYPFTRIDATEDLRQRVAASRRLPASAVRLAEERGWLSFAVVHSLDSWLVHDLEARIYEARPVDGGMYAATDRLPHRKTHSRCNPGGKNWPIGLERITRQPGLPILFAEGSADFLAAVAVCESQLAVPCAVLGSADIHPAAIPRFAGRKIFIATHRDRAGCDAAMRWAVQLRAVGCAVRGLVFDSGDLNDQVAEGATSEIQNFLL